MLGFSPFSPDDPRNELLRRHGLLATPEMLAMQAGGLLGMPAAAEAGQQQGGEVGGLLRPKGDGGLVQSAQSLTPQPINQFPAAAKDEAEPSWMDKLGTGLNNNGALLMSLGAGLASGRNWGEGLSNGLQLGAQAVSAQNKNQLDRLKLQREQAALQGNAALVRRINPSLSAQEAQAVAQNPSLMQKIYETGYPSDAWESAHVGGRLVQRNRLSGEVRAHPGQEATPEALKVFQDARTNWRQYGLPDPNSPDPADQATWRNYAQAKLFAGGQQINIDNRAEGAEAGTLGKARGERAAELESGAAKASSQIAKLNLISSLLDKARTGALGPAEANIVGLAQSVGIPDERIKQLGLNPSQAITSEAVAKVVNELTVGSIGAGGFPANNFSDADRAFLQKIFPSISNRPEANEIALDVMRRVEQRKLDTAQAWGEYQDRMRAAGKSPEFSAFEREYRRRVSGESLFGDLQERIGGLQGVSRSPSALGVGQSNTIDGATIKRVR